MIYVFELLLVAESSGLIELILDRKAALSILVRGLGEMPQSESVGGTPALASSFLDLLVL